ncbi:MAG: hypothetical protein ACJ0S4_00855 [Candidatus Rariloculaceae bacterium]
MNTEDNADVKLEENFTAYKDTPSKENFEALVDGAELYKEYWIATRSAAKPYIQKNPDTPTRYKRICSVRGTQLDGTEITLALQHRTQPDKTSFYAVSWRTRLGSADSNKSVNRRFYITNGKIWSLPLKEAIHMLEKLEEKGGFNEKYFDLRVEPDTSFVASETLEDVTMVDEDWGNNPFLLVLKDPNEDWRKVLIVNREIGVATFRSITKCAKYKPRKELCPGHNWVLDNSMQDVSVQLAQVFLNKLREEFEDSVSAYDSPASE